MNRIEKVKYDGTRVRIEYSVERQDGRFDERVLSCYDEPIPEFKTALAALVEDVCDICELPADQAEKMRVQSVSLSYTNDILGLVITALKSVKTAQSPVVLNTPHIPAQSYAEGGEGPVLADNTLMRVETVTREAERYIDGERAQQSLPMPVESIELTLAHA